MRKASLPFDGRWGFGRSCFSAMFLGSSVRFLACLNLRFTGNGWECDHYSTQPWWRHPFWVAQGKFHWGAGGKVSFEAERPEVLHGLCRWQDDCTLLWTAEAGSSNRGGTESQSVIAVGWLAEFRWWTCGWESAAGETRRNRPGTRCYSGAYGMLVWRSSSSCWSSKSFMEMGRCSSCSTFLAEWDVSSDGSLNPGGARGSSAAVLVQGCFSMFSCRSGDSDPENSDCGRYCEDPMCSSRCLQCDEKPASSLTVWGGFDRCSHAFGQIYQGGSFFWAWASCFQARARVLISVLRQPLRHPSSDLARFGHLFRGGISLWGKLRERLFIVRVLPEALEAILYCDIE